VITVGGFNTSVDKSMEADELTPGTVIRVRDVRASPGGKGLHVALAAAALGEAVCLVGLIDSAHRREFEDVLGVRGVEFDAVETQAAVRTCLAIHDRRGQRVTELLEPGPEADEATRGALCARFLYRASRSSVSVLSGSVPRGFPDRVYGDLVAGARASGGRVLLDASGALLEHGVAAHPFLVKPNREEAEALAGTEIDGPAAAAHVARTLVSRGPGMVIVSLGEEGAVAVAGGRAAHAWVRAAAAVANPVGSGDCLLGGVAVALAREQSLEEALRLGVACGAANAMSRETGRFDRADVEKLLPRVELATL
jgi:1-phosphofructokinase family hexose kinase